MACSFEAQQCHGGTMVHDLEIDNMVVQDLLDV